MIRHCIHDGRCPALFTLAAYSRRHRKQEGRFRDRKRPLPAVMIEPMTGIEPAYSAWEADVLPLNYIGVHDIGRP